MKPGDIMRFIILFFLMSTVLVYGQKSDSSFTHKPIIFSHLRLNLQANVLQTFVTDDSIGKNEYMKSNSFAAGFEWVFNYKNNLSYGFGFLYQVPGSIKALDGKFGNIPIYTFLDLPVINNDPFQILLSLRFGASLVSTNGKIERNQHGIYHAEGITFDINDEASIKLLYTNSYGGIKNNGHDYNVNNGNMSFVFCLKF